MSENEPKKTGFKTFRQKTVALRMVTEAISLISVPLTAQNLRICFYKKYKEGI